MSKNSVFLLKKQRAKGCTNNKIEKHTGKTTFVREKDDTGTKHAKIFTFWRSLRKEILDFCKVKPKPKKQKDDDSNKYDTFSAFVAVWKAEKTKVFRKRHNTA